MKKCASKSQNRICARFYGPAIPYSSTTRKSTASRNSTSARTVRWSINTFCLASERRATTSRRAISYAVFCLKKKKKNNVQTTLDQSRTAQEVQLENATTMRDVAL